MRALDKTVFRFPSILSPGPIGDFGLKAIEYGILFTWNKRFDLESYNLFFFKS